jgi:hypothetical protein
MGTETESVMMKTFDLQLTEAGVNLVLALLNGAIHQYGKDIEEALEDSMAHPGEFGHSWVCHIEQCEAERDSLKDLRGSIRRQLRVQHARN